VKEFSVPVDGKEVQIFAKSYKGVLWIHYNGQTYSFDADNGRRRKPKGRGSSAETGEILAPMPGKIIQVTASKKSEVQEGEVLVVMEAMKMEYSLKSPRSGKIEKLHIAEGDQVMLGQILVSLEKI
jgi:acetyl/propionyl-CoA carboxylase alpha subunit